MPYIPQAVRDKLDCAVDGVMDALDAAGEEGEDYIDWEEGHLAYVLTTLLAQVNKRYKDLAVTLGVLESVKLEFYRRVVGPYEDQKCLENGEVYDDPRPFHT